MRVGLSHRVLAIVAEAYEVGWRELMRDARAAWTWQGPADELVAQVSGQHGWPGGLTDDNPRGRRRVRPHAPLGAERHHGRRAAAVLPHGVRMPYDMRTRRARQPRTALTGRPLRQWSHRARRS
jgi:hypothetical protein